MTGSILLHPQDRRRLNLAQSSQSRGVAETGSVRLGHQSKTPTTNTMAQSRTRTMRSQKNLHNFKTSSRGSGGRTQPGSTALKLSQSAGNKQGDSAATNTRQKTTKTPNAQRPIIKKEIRLYEVKETPRNVEEAQQRAQATAGNHPKEKEDEADQNLEAIRQGVSHAHKEEAGHAGNEKEASPTNRSAASSGNMLPPCPEEYSMI